MEAVVTQVRHTSILHLKGIDSKIKALDEKLFGVLQRNRKSKDVRSQELLNWCVRAIEVADCGRGECDSVVKVVGELSNIIVTRIDHSPITDPVCANGRLWDRWMLEHVRLVFEGKNPYDDKDLEEGRVHPLAKEILVATQVFNSSVTRGAWLKCLNLSEYSVSDLKKVYLDLVYIELENERIDAETAMFKKASLELKVQTEVIEESSKRQIEILANRVKELRKWVVDAAESMRSIYLRQIQRLQSDLDFANHELVELRGTLIKTEEKVARLEAVVASLSYTISDLRGRVQSLENDDGGGGCSIM